MFSKSSVVGVIGSGAMGSGIAQVAASAGHSVIVHDSNKAALDKAKANLAAGLKKLVEKQKLTAQDASSIESRISWAAELKAFSACEIIIEAIVENLEVKQKLFSE